MDHIKIRNFTSADRDWLVTQHGVLYAQSEGFDDSFGSLVAEILDDFIVGHDPSVEAGWIAEENGQRLGSIFCVRLTETTAKLRLFLLVPEARGKGLGKRLLQTCMSFAKDRGYADMQLWTHESHAAACALYKSTGWQMVGSKPVHSFGQNLVEQSWTYRF
ncbi:GNAT family N-acetyltransferase [uncultured Roseobacter sp.]|uniref:GNAT family N-acetyltransferase n=1 Tax=uncultured Roseobacter sp. TaxID=114847 RepID=UPI00263181CC|nr:GNAT family N-acetyltransferase [uncultured Roseobacter sp.]